MHNIKRPSLLIVGGFSLAALCWAIIMFADPSEGIQVIMWIGQALGIGLGSIGIGTRVAQNAKRS